MLTWLRRWFPPIPPQMTQQERRDAVLRICRFWVEYEQHRAWLQGANAVCTALEKAGIPIPSIEIEENPYPLPAYPL